MPDDQPVPNQSWYAKQQQIKLAAALAPLLHDLGCNVVDDPSDHAPWDKASRYVRPASSWRKDNMVIEFWQQPDYHHKVTGRTTIRFSAARWQPGAGTIRKDPPQVAEKFETPLSDSDQIIHNGLEDPIHFAYSQEVTLTDTYGSSITKGLEQDLTVNTEASTETTISGEYAGVSAEQKVALSVGVEVSSAESREEAQEEAHEGARAEALAIEGDAPPHEYIKISHAATQQNTYQHKDIDSSLDYDFNFEMNEHHETEHYGGRLPDRTVKAIGVSGLEQLVHGWDTDHPGMEGYWQKAAQRVKDGIAYATSAAARRITIELDEEAETQASPTYDIVPLGSDVPDELANLPVKSAEDL